MEDSVRNEIKNQDIEESYNAVMEWQPQYSVESIEECVSSAAKSEALKDLYFSDGLSPQMKNTCLTPMKKNLTDFQQLFSQFEQAMLPVMAQIREINQFKEDEKNIEKKIQIEIDAENRKIDENSEYKYIKSRIKDAESVYGKQKKSEGNREPKIPSWKYYVALILIGIVECFLNLEAFAQWIGHNIGGYFFSIAVAIIIAVFADVHGKMIAQYSQRFGAHVSKESKIKNYWGFIMTSFLPLVALGLVGFARYRSMIAAVPVIDGLSVVDFSEVIMSALMSVGGNLLVWGVSATISWMVHDSNQLFVDSFKTLGRLNREKFKLKAQTSAEVKRLISKEIEEKKKLQKTVDAKKQALGIYWTRWSQVEDKRESLFADQLAETNRLVTMYRNELLKHFNSENFRMFNDSSVITADEYRTLNVKINKNDVPSNLVWG